VYYKVKNTFPTASLRPYFANPPGRSGNAASLTVGTTRDFAYTAGQVAWAKKGLPIGSCAQFFLELFENST
jgi:hypothetical protein